MPAEPSTSPDAAAPPFAAVHEGGVLQYAPPEQIGPSTADVLCGLFHCAISVALAAAGYGYAWLGKKVDNGLFTSHGRTSAAGGTLSVIFFTVTAAAAVAALASLFAARRAFTRHKREQIRPTPDSPQAPPLPGRDSSSPRLTAENGDSPALPRPSP
jgi:hypothetical protein